ncbi:MAG: hypothetical protein GQ581_00590 [Methyloprofundus sp.]|nr:hypothetical protein [Methyloprofundus sp.]
MKSNIKTALTLIFSFLFTTSAYAEPIIYPAKGQSAQQTEQDKYQCYSWAKDNSGFDPMQSSAPAAQQSNAGQGAAVRGAAKGAASGAIIGAIAGDAGKGAAIGAASGGMMGGMRRRGAQRQQEQVQQQAQQQYSAARSEYDRAYSACLTGRGYSVN